jgi:hypothetical protein
MKIKNYKLINKGSITAVMDVYIEQWALSIHVTEMAKENQKWISLPSRQYDKDGQKKYQWLCWFDKEAHQRFQMAVFKLLEAGDFEKAPDSHVQQQLPFEPKALDDDVPF